MKLRKRKPAGEEDTSRRYSRPFSSVRRSRVGKEPSSPKAGSPRNKTSTNIFRRLRKSSRNQPPEDQSPGDQSPSAPARSTGANTNLDLPHEVDLEPPGPLDTDDAPWNSGAEANRQLPPRNPYSYPASRSAWSYEVETESEIYRISTHPNDFFGNSNMRDGCWTRPLKAAHAAYKAVQEETKIAESRFIREPPQGPLEKATYIPMKREIYVSSKNENKARAEFLQVWPSAFGATENFAGHIAWHRKLEDQARTCQREALRFGYEERATDPDFRRRPDNNWIFESVDDWKVKPIYAMSPEQYEELYTTVRDKKERLRAEIEAADWFMALRPPKTITLPNLPAPRRDLPIPEYTQREKEILRLPDIYRLPLSLFEHLTRDNHDGN